MGFIPQICVEQREDFASTAVGAHEAVPSEQLRPPRPNDRALASAPLLSDGPSICSFLVRKGNELHHNLGWFAPFAAAAKAPANDRGHGVTMTFMSDGSRWVAVSASDTSSRPKCWSTNESRSMRPDAASLIASR